MIKEAEVVPGDQVGMRVSLLATRSVVLVVHIVIWAIKDGSMGEFIATAGNPDLRGEVSRGRSDAKRIELEHHAGTPVIVDDINRDPSSPVSGQGMLAEVFDAAVVGRAGPYISASRSASDDIRGAQSLGALPDEFLRGDLDAQIRTLARVVQFVD